MFRSGFWQFVFWATAVAVSTGCRSPYYADRGAGLGALVGGLGGAAIGSAKGHTAAGALIGTAAGALGGAAIGTAIDSEVARNNALIEERLGRQLAGAVTIPDVIALSQAEVGEDVIVSHIRANGVAQMPTVDDIIVMSRQGVSTSVIRAMQQPPVAASTHVPVRYAPPPVIVEEHYYDYGPRFYPHWGHYRRACPPPGFHWGVTISD